MIAARQEGHIVTGGQVLEVVRFNQWVNPAFDETFVARPDVRLRVRPYEAPRDETLAVLAQANVLQVSAARDELPRPWHVTGELLEHCPRLVCVSSGGAGYDTIDVDACTRAGVAVVNQSGGNAASVAEHTMGLLLAVTHRIAQSDRWLRSHRGFRREALTGREIGGLTIGLVGIGQIGRRVARLAQAFGMQVLATDPYVGADEIELRGATPVTLDDLLRRCDVVSVHCPRNAETMKLFAAPQFERMKPGAIFLTTARGGIHDEAALHAALASGHLSGAGLDVWDVEPPPLDSPLLTHDAVVATYHTAGVTAEARRRIAGMAAAQILEVLDGRRPPRLVNPPVWDAYRARYERVLGRAPV